MPSVQRILQLASPSCYLAANYKENGILFGGRSKSTDNQATLIYIYYKILNKIYSLDPNHLGLQAPANYLYELEQKFAFKAANIVDGGGGGSITPITPTVRPQPYFFIVDDTSFIVNGQNSKSIPEFAGFNLAFSRGQGWESTINTEASYYSWDRTNAVFTCFPAAVTSELFILMPT